MVGDRRQFFPRRELSTIEYSIEQTYQGLYQQIRTHLMSADPSLPNEPRLSFARYAIWDYVNTDQRGREPYLQLRRSSVALHGLVRTLLFKRFESSVVAFRVSVQRMAQSHRVFLLAIQEGIVPAGDEAQQVLRESDEDINETLDTLRSMSVRYPITDFDVARLTRDVQRDIELFERIIQLVEPITPDRDEKLLVLRSRLAQSPLAEGKRLIFTQFADTARYLFDQLSALDRPGARVAIMLSGDGNKSRIIGRFAPRSNPEYANHHPDEGISLLIATDVLSEGHNLQDCDKIINYDLHWNPVRLIQRFGRIDRIGSEFETIHGFNFLPEAGIERNLGLRQILRERIREIHDTIGEDSSILEAGEQLNTEAMYAIYEANGEPLAALEEELDSESVHLNEAEELLRHLRERDPDEYARIANLPDGIRSARRTNANGLFVFSRAGDYRRLLLVDREGRIISHDLPKILGLLKCAKDTPIAECPAYPTLPLLRTFHRFVQEWRERRTELNHMPHLTSAQRYVLRELNQLMSNPADSAMLSRIEQMDRAFRGSLPQALLRELNRIRRDGTEGEVMLRILIGLYFAHGLQHRESESNTRRDEEWPQIICSEAFLKSP